MRTMPVASVRKASCIPLTALCCCLWCHCIGWSLGVMCFVVQLRRRSRGVRLVCSTCTNFEDILACTDAHSPLLLRVPSDSVHEQHFDTSSFIHISTTLLNAETCIADFLLDGRLCEESSWFHSTRTRMDSLQLQPHLACMMHCQSLSFPRRTVRKSELLMLTDMSLGDTG